MQQHPASSPKLVQDFLQQSAARRPNKTALVCEQGRYTYAQIEAMANRLANGLKAKGLNRGDRVGIYLGNCLEAVVGVFAVLKAGGVFVPINPTTKREKLSSILNNCRATGLLAGWHSLAAAQEEPIEAAVPSLRIKIGCGKPFITRTSGSEEPTDMAVKRGWQDFEHLQCEQPDSQPAASSIDLDLACLIYTSGSTGEPKGVMSDHSNVIFASGSIMQYLENVEDDVVLNVLPLSFDYGLYQLLMTFRFGGRLVLERSFTFPATVMKTIEAEQVTGFPGVPTMFAMLLQMDLTAFDLSRLRYITNTAAALPPSQVLALRRKFPGVKLFSMYGLTETKRTLYLPPAQLEVRPASVGIPIPGTEAWLEDSSGKRLGLGELGELVVRGRHVMRGYWEAPEASAHRFRPGPIPGERLCYTGDLFRTDQEGYFYFVGRQDDIIKSRGEKVAPREVENVLHCIPGVQEAAVVGVTDPVLGQAIKAVIVRRGGEPTASQVMAYCREHLEDYMLPKHIEFRDALPKTPSGKVNKLELAAEIPIQSAMGIQSPDSRQT